MDLELFVSNNCVQKFGVQGAGRVISDSKGGMWHAHVAGDTL